MTRYTILSGSTLRLKDTEDFIVSIADSIAKLPRDWRDLFNSEPDVIVTRAPGRLDLMGGIADYSGSLVLQLPIENAVHVALQTTAEPSLRIASLPDSDGTLRLFEIDISELRELTGSDYHAACRHFAVATEQHWAAYVAGALVVLMREKGFPFDQGARILIQSNVPEGKGVSSSAALEVAVMQALAVAYEIDLSPSELALLCQQVENEIVGAACGIMDQMTAACGEPDRLLELLCQPAQLKGTISLPDELEVWGIDSGIRHSVAGADYRTVRTAAFMGYRIIAGVAGLAAFQREAAGQVDIADPKWKGYLANLTPEEFRRDYEAQFPERITGKDFLTRYQGITDRATSVEPEIEYPIKAATRHPIQENARVQMFAETLKHWEGIEQARLLGELMFESHASYSNCGLGSDGTDKLVALVRAFGAGRLFGAKITGGGSGGTVAILGRRGSYDLVRQVADEYQKTTGHQPTIISGSSPGAAAFGNLRLRRIEEGTSL